LLLFEAVFVIISANGEAFGYLEEAFPSPWSGLSILQGGLTVVDVSGGFSENRQTRETSIYLEWGAFSANGQVFGYLMEAFASSCGQVFLSFFKEARQS
jgi:hypothetical protein